MLCIISFPAGLNLIAKRVYTVLLNIRFCGPFNTGTVKQLAGRFEVRHVIVIIDVAHILPAKPRSYSQLRLLAPLVRS